MGGPSQYIEFASPPGLAWSKHPDQAGFYHPNKRHKAGKQASRELSAASKNTRTLQDEIAIKILGSGPILSGHHMLWPGLTSLCGDRVVTATMPDPSNREQWKPIAGLRRLKDSEYWKLVEDDEAAKGAIDGQ